MTKRPSHPCGPSPRHAPRIEGFDNADANGDGVLSRDEFGQFGHQLQQQLGQLMGSDAVTPPKALDAAGGWWVPRSNYYIY